MASIYKRGRIWWVHYLVGGKSISRSLRTTNERIAQEKKKRLEALEVTGQLRKPSNTPADSFLQSFCEFLLQTRTRKSAKNDISYLRMFFGLCCPALQPGSPVNHRFTVAGRATPKAAARLYQDAVPIRHMEQLSTEMISDYIQRRIARDHIAPKTANRMREVLYRMFSYAIERFGYICPDQRYRNPVEGVRRAREPAPLITWLKEKDIRQQLSAFKGNPTLHALVATLIYAGLRRSEALWLTVDDVNLDRKLIYVRAKTVDGQYWQPKTKRNRTVPISSTLHQILEEYSPQRAEPWFFPSTLGKRWDPDNFSQDLREINSEHGLSWSSLDFRHTFGSHLAQKGESLYKIAELMGNSPEICRRHYAALMPEKMHDVVEFETGAPCGDGRTERMLKQILNKLEPKDSTKTGPQLRIVKLHG